MGCQKSIDIDKKQELYYCAVFEQGGTHLVPYYRILSYEKLLKEKNFLMKNEDAYYYKIEDDKGKKILYAYSIKNHNLEKILRTDNKQRLVHIEYTQRDINCTQQYRTNNSTMRVTRECSNGDKRIKYYIYKKSGGYTPNKSLYYKNSLLNKTVKYKDGTARAYDKHNNLLWKGREIAISDLCTPYVTHNLKDNIDVYGN